MALAREHPGIKRLREKAVRKQVIKIPARRTALGLPCPPVPSVARGEGVKLSLNVAAGISLLFVSELRNRTSGLADTAVGDGSLGVRVFVGAVVSSSLMAAVEVLGAVGQGTAPFTNNSRDGGFGEFVLAEFACSLDVLVDVQGDELRREDLVVVGVDDGLGPEVEAVPLGWAHEGIGNDNSDVGVGALDLGGTLAVEVLERFDLNASLGERLVDEVDFVDNTFLPGVSLDESVEGFVGLCDSVALLPVGRAQSAAVIEAVLRSRG